MNDQARHNALRQIAKQVNKEINQAINGKPIKDHLKIISDVMKRHEETVKQLGFTRSWLIYTIGQINGVFKET